ncbi:MAG: Flp pilus assembly protein CpaB [Actinomycetota bacterium]
MTVGTLSKRGVGLLVALLLAAFATAAWVSYVRSIERKAIGGAKTVQIYVAGDVIPAGTTAEQADERKLFVRTAVPRRLVAEGAVTSLPALRGTVASTTIVKGEQILRARFVSPEVAARVLQIPPDHQAMSVEVGAPPGVGGFVGPHDRVNVIAKVQANGTAVVKFVLQDVQVLAVGSRTTASPPSGSRESERREDAGGQASESLLLTLAVTPSEAEQLAFALLEGEVYFTLLPPGAKPSGTPGRTAESLFR